MLLIETGVAPRWYIPPGDVGLGDDSNPSRPAPPASTRAKPATSGCAAAMPSCGPTVIPTSRRHRRPRRRRGTTRRAGHRRRDPGETAMSDADSHARETSFWELAQQLLAEPGVTQEHHDQVPCRGERTSSPASNEPPGTSSSSFPPAGSPRWSPPARHCPSHLTAAPSVSGQRSQSPTPANGGQSWSRPGNTTEDEASAASRQAASRSWPGSPDNPEGAAPCATASCLFGFQEPRAALTRGASYWTAWYSPRLAWVHAG